MGRVYLHVSLSTCPHLVVPGDGGGGRVGVHGAGEIHVVAFLQQVGLEGATEGGGDGGWVCGEKDFIPLTNPVQDII